MAKRATIRDLADRAGVSVSTIDCIMNGRDKVRAGTATKVLAAWGSCCNNCTGLSTA